MESLGSYIHTLGESLIYECESLAVVLRQWRDIGDTAYMRQTFSPTRCYCNISSETQLKAPRLRVHGTLSAACNVILTV